MENVIKSETKLEIGQTIYITKYALSKGIVKSTIYRISSKNDNYIYTERFGNYYVLNDNVFLTLEEACQDAEKQRLRKIKSLKKQLQRLESKSFKDVIFE